MRSVAIRRFFALFLPAFLGILILVMATAPQIREQITALPEVPPFPFPVLLLLSVLQPAILAAIAVALGLRFAPRLGLRSHLAAWGEKAPLSTALRAELPLAMGLGMATALLIAVVDSTVLPLLGSAGEKMAILSNRGWEVTLYGVAYGGITEEVLMRWGLMPLLAVAARALFQQPKEDPPSPLVMWSAIFLSALLFGVGHLPALSQAFDLTGPLVARTIVLNGVGGIVFGWLFWRKSLEAAMVAHATVHVTWSLAAFVF